MMFPIIEFIDRLAIAMVKYERTQANYDELMFYQNQSGQIDLPLVNEEFTELKVIHNKIWDLESELKSGRENELPLEEIGRRAILIRDWNNKRIKLKNIIAERLGCAVREVKSNHLSE